MGVVLYRGCLQPEADEITKRMGVDKKKKTLKVLTLEHSIIRENYRN